LTQAQPALIHAHFGPDAIAALPLSRKLALPLLATFHGYDATRDMSASADAHQQNYRDALPSLFKKVTRIIAVSDYIRERVIALGAPPERTYTHYIGVDTTRFSPAGERDPSLVLAVGRFVEKKGFEDLIRAFGAVASTRPDARLVMLGDGPLRGELERMARAQSGRIELLGAVPSEEVLSWLRRAAILAAPSVTASDGDTEGLPTIVVESMACGTPVLATQHAGTPEAILHERTGLLVPERATEALSSALSRLLADHALRQALGAAGRARALDEFDLTAQVGKLEAHYDAAARDGCRT
jgi:glycosyltransferase involved in cell wall biosynthesis